VLIFQIIRAPQTLSKPAFNHRVSVYPAATDCLVWDRHFIRAPFFGDFVTWAIAVRKRLLDNSC
ncbi:hypothetical protein, partial [Bradyrhizobium uaiense]|uniref:hypothetical protein n=1 Tax=Bradyrhizobium uaiense TaxID=2594946 RepID=UPI0019D639B4